MICHKKPNSFSITNQRLINITYIRIYIWDHICIVAYAQHARQRAFCNTTLVQKDAFIYIIHSNKINEHIVLELDIHCCYYYYIIHWAGTGRRQVESVCDPIQFNVYFPRFMACMCSIYTHITIIVI